VPYPVVEVPKTSRHLECCTSRGSIPKRLGGRHHDVAPELLKRVQPNIDVNDGPIGRDFDYSRYVCSANKIVRV
jgi:hypothetical protein